MLKVYNKISCLLWLVLILFINCSDNNIKREYDGVIRDGKKVLLIGVSHFGLYDQIGLKDFDILSNENQDELDKISKSIKDFGTTKIYVEWPRIEQSKLDSLYLEYLVQDKDQKDIEPVNEIYQLAFRSGKLSNLESITAIDIGESLFPIDKVLSKLNKSESKLFSKELTEYQKYIETVMSRQMNNGASILELIKYTNSEELRKKDIGMTHKLLELGGVDNKIGVEVLSNWYKKHLDIWSHLQKDVKRNNDQRIVIIYGASHIAILEKIIKSSEGWEITELESIL